MKDINPYGREAQQTQENHTQISHSQIAEIKD